MMTTLHDELIAAEHKMRQAFEALVKYLDRPDSEAPDIKLHRRLADDLTLATARYVTLVSKLKPSGA
jgi:hypothetical protein